MKCISGSGPDSNILFQCCPDFSHLLKLPEVICPNCSSELYELSFILPSIREAEASKDYYLIFFLHFTQNSSSAASYSWERGSSDAHRIKIGFDDKIYYSLV
jgi:hypothetical protein